FLPFLLVWLFIRVPPLLSMTKAILAGERPVLALALLILSGVGLIAVGFRLLKLHEEMPEYRWITWWGVSAANRRANQLYSGGTGTSENLWRGWFSNACRKLDHLSGPIGTGIWTRVRHRRLGFGGGF